MDGRCNCTKVDINVGIFHACQKLAGILPKEARYQIMETLHWVLLNTLQHFTLNRT